MKINSQSRTWEQFGIDMEKNASGNTTKSIWKNYFRVK